MIPPKKKAAPAKPKKAATRAASQPSSARAGLRPAGKAKKPSIAPKTAPKKEARASEEKRETKKDAGPKLSIIRIRLSAFDHTVLDEAAAKILETAQRSGALVHGPIPPDPHPQVHREPLDVRPQKRTRSV